jgi:hypothetical protein
LFWSGVEEAEQAWYRLCSTAEFIPEQTLKEFRRALPRRRRRAAMAEGLREFTEARCPVCGTRGHFRVGQMGRLTHPGCTSWLMPAGAYVARVALQVAPAVIAFPFRVLMAVAGSAAHPRSAKPQPPPDPRPACACGTRLNDEDRFCPTCGRRRPL